MLQFVPTTHETQRRGQTSRWRKSEDCTDERGRSRAGRVPQVLQPREKKRQSREPSVEVEKILTGHEEDHRLLGLRRDRSNDDGVDGSTDRDPLKNVSPVSKSNQTLVEEEEIDQRAKEEMLWRRGSSPATPRALKSATLEVEELRSAWTRLRERVCEQRSEDGQY